MKQLHRPRLILRAGGFQTESVKNHTDYRKVSRFEQKQGLVHSCMMHQSGLLQVVTSVGENHHLLNYYTSHLINMTLHLL